MNWKCLFRQHGEWKMDRIPFTNEKLRRCGRCRHIEIWTPNGWIPFTGPVAVVGLTFALAEMKKYVK